MKKLRLVGSLSLPFLVVWASFYLGHLIGIPFETIGWSTFPWVFTCFALFIISWVIAGFQWADYEPDRRNGGKE